MREEEIELEAADGFRLAGTVLEPDGDDAGPAVVVAPATGTKRSFYLRFSRWLAGRGLPVLTFDYRGVGGSRPEGSLRSVDATMREWGEKDLDAALRLARDRWPGMELTAVGHSYGGQALGLAPSAHSIERAVLVAAQSGYWGHWDLARGVPFALLWYVVMPGLARLLGYFPSKMLGLGEDLPAGVALQWARWCRSPDYIGDWKGHARLDVRILALSFEDDTYATRESVEWLNGRFERAEVVHRHRTPEELGVDAVGHMGFFREGRVPELWEEARAWLAGDAHPGRGPGGA